MWSIPIKPLISLAAHQTSLLQRSKSTLLCFANAIDFINDTPVHGLNSSRMSKNPSSLPPTSSRDSSSSSDSSTTSSSRSSATGIPNNLGASSRHPAAYTTEEKVINYSQAVYEYTQELWENARRQAELEAANRVRYAASNPLTGHTTNTSGNTSARRRRDSTVVPAPPK
ncbi:uncharacterized protein EI90DRAFT_1995773 [Cantharellus anzutake]|uniref:uncharacterized protein n=1 Tax=Cantharellus anzutake TaxID=1750568 RepID=UPI0019040220|nr:uncharacterized protein EI90DRAFT_1995773 [Cantharellus anzutake]KAF8326091.1 hypothetical protein EI90DRAFT_1995773 [Cantharellus anzutake]